MSSMTTVSKCVKCAGVFEEAFRPEEGHYSGLCRRCGYNLYEYPVAGQTQESIYEKGVQMELKEFGGYGILCVEGEAHILDDDSPETLTKAMQILSEFEADAAYQFLTARVDGKLVCLEGEMPPAYDELMGQAEEAPARVSVGAYAEDDLPF